MSRLMLLRPSALLATFFSCTLFPAVSFAESACGIVDGKTVTECKMVREEKTCTERCEPVSMVKTCTTQCAGSCTETDTTACSASCETENLETCTADPTTYECAPECTTLCKGSCSGHCSSSLDKASCSGHCESECAETCTEKCTALPATETCENRVKTSCDASCTVENTIACEVECETECSTELKGACTTQCTTKGGALFCQEQYIEGGVDLSACVDEIQSSGSTVEGWIIVDSDGTATGTKTEGDGVSCVTSRTTTGASFPLIAGAGALLLLLVGRSVPRKLSESAHRKSSRDE